MSTLRIVLLIFGCLCAGTIFGLFLATLLGANASADYREKVRREVKAEALAQDWGKEQ